MVLSNEWTEGSINMGQVAEGQQAGAWTLSALHPCPPQEPWLWLGGSGPCRGQWTAPAGSRQRTSGTFMTFAMFWARESLAGPTGSTLTPGLGTRVEWAAESKVWPPLDSWADGECFLLSPAWRMYGQCRKNSE